MATFGDFDNTTLLFSNNEPPESNNILIWKNTLTKRDVSYKEKDLINKVKCFKENYNHEVWSDRKLLFWFTKDEYWIEIK